MQTKLWFTITTQNHLFQLGPIVIVHIKAMTPSSIIILSIHTSACAFEATRALRASRCFASCRSAYDCSAAFFVAYETNSESWRWNESQFDAYGVKREWNNVWMQMGRRSVSGRIFLGLNDKQPSFRWRTANEYADLKKVWQTTLLNIPPRYITFIPYFRELEWSAAMRLSAPPYLLSLFCQERGYPFFFLLEFGLVGPSPRERSPAIIKSCSNVVMLRV